MRAAVLGRAAAAAALAAAAAAPPALAQDSRLAGRLDPATRAAVEAVVDSARRRGLPTEPLVDKALEGASKRAPGPRIVAALRTLASDLALARDALGERTPEPDLVAGAGALRAGARPEALRELRQARRDQPVTVPLAVLSDLVARGVPPDTAAAVVVALARRGAGDRDFGELERGVARDIEAGASPAAAASVRGGGGDGAGDHGGGPGGSGTSQGGDEGPRQPGAQPEQPGAPGDDGAVGGKPDQPATGQPHQPGTGKPDQPGAGKPDKPGGGKPDKPPGKPGKPGGGKPPGPGP